MIWILLFLTFANVTNICSSNQELFLQANAFYHQKKYTDAIEHYKAIKPCNAAIWYNMGVCWYMQENYIKALQCWYHAHQHPYFKSMTDEKIAELRNLLHIPQDSSFLNMIEKFLGQSLLLWQLVGLLLVYLFALAVYYNKKKVILFLIFLISLNSICLAFSYTTVKQIRGYCIYKGEVKAGKNVHFSPLAPLVVGQEVIVLDKQDEWYKIKTQNNIYGWVLANTIETL